MQIIYCFGTFLVGEGLSMEAVLYSVVHHSLIPLACYTDTSAYAVVN